MLRFGVLGPLEVVRNGDAVVLTSAMQRRLLAVLVSRANEVVPVDALVDALWGEHPPATATGALRTYVSALRKAIEPSPSSGEPRVLRTTAPGYRLVVGPEDLDAGRFERLVAEGRDALRAGQPAAAAGLLREALALWRGPAYADVAAGPTVHGEALRLEELRVLAVEERVEADIALGRHAELVGELAGLVEAHPLRERLWSQRIRCLYRVGRQAEALAAYQDLRHRLAEELGLDPSHELATLERDVLSQAPALAWHPGPPASSAAGAPVRPDGDLDPGRGGGIARAPLPTPIPLAVAGGGPFIAADGVLGRLQEQWRRASTGARQLALVVGEPGIGKTRVAAELARWVEGEGGAVLWGGCDQFVALPYQPFVEVLRHLVEHAPTDVLAAGAPDGELLRVVPALGERLPLAAQAEPADPGVARLRLFDAVTTMLGAAAASAPVLLVVDDLHWATETTVALFRHVAVDHRPGRVMVLGSYRDTEAPPLVADVADDLVARHGARRLRLRGLTEEAVGDYLVARARDGSADLSARAGEVFARTSGNPFFVGQVVEHLVETGAAGEPGIPEGVRALVTARLSRLTGEANRVLDVAAIMGQVFDRPSLERLADAAPDPDALLGALDEAVVAGLVTGSPQRPDRYAFCHELVRETVLDRLTAARRARFHRRIGEALAGMPGADPAVVAHHLCEGASDGGVEVALEWTLEALGEARHRLAPHEAVAIAERGLDVIAASDAPLVLARGWLRLQLSGVVALLGDHARAAELAAAAIDDATATGDGSLLAFTAIDRMQRIIGRGADPVAERLVLDALTALDRDDPHAIRPALLGKLAAYRSINLGQGADADDIAAEAVRLAREVPPDQDRVGILASALSERANVLLGSADLATRRQVLGEFEALLVAESVEQCTAWFTGWESEAHAALGLSLRAAIELQAGDRAAFDQALGELGAVTRSPRAAGFRERFVLLSGLDALARGDLEAAAGWEEQLPDHPGALVVLHDMQRFELRRAQGRLAEVLPRYREVAAQAGGVPHITTMLAVALSETGAAAEAHRLLGELSGDRFGAVPRNSRWPGMLAYLATECARAGRDDLAPDLHDLLEPYEGQLLVISVGAACLGAADRHLAMLEALLRRHDRALEHFAAALALEERAKADALAAVTRTWWARTLLDRGRPGDRDRAADLLAGAEETVARCGLRHLDHDLAALRPRCGVS